MGNAVCPMVAAALGRCLALAAQGTSPEGQPIVGVRFERLDQVRSIMLG